MKKSLNLKYNIIHVTPYYPPHLGGMENCVMEITEEMRKTKKNVKVLTSTIGRKMAKTYKHVSYLQSVEVAKTPIMFALAIKLLALPKKSIIHVHISQALTPEIVYLVSKFRKIPYIAHVHLDTDPTGALGFLLEPYKKIFLRRVLQNAVRVIALSESQKSFIRQKYDIPLQKITVIPNGVSKSFFVKRKNRKNNKPTVLYVGRLAEHKKVDRLVKAFAMVKSSAELHIVGRGEEYQKIANLTNRLKIDNIKMLGQKSPEELKEMYTQADMFVLPSDKEGVPLVLLEAMAAGLPIVASDISGVREIIGKAGVLIKSPSPRKFAAAIDTLLADKKLQIDLSKKAKKRAQEFEWKSVVRQIEDVYQEVIYEA